MIRAGVRRALWLALRRRDRWEREVEEEIKLHLMMRAEQLVANGHTPDDAYAEAVRRFGPLSESRARLVDAARHRETRMERTEYLDDLRQDIAFGLRTLRRQKAWTAVMILTLALGIGATTAVFSVVSALILHTVSYPHAERVVQVFMQPTTGNNTGISVSISVDSRTARAWIATARSFEALEPATMYERRNLKTVSGEPSVVETTAITPTFASFAGEHPILGREFTKTDLTSNPNVVMLGESFWRQRFGADRNVLGKRLTLGDTTYAIIGVMPATLVVGSNAGTPPDVWRPLDLRNDSLGLQLIGRLRPGITTQIAARELDSIAARTMGFSGAKDLPFRTSVVRPADRLSFHDSLVLLAWAVALVLVVACANGAHLLLARASTRQREMAIRAALGAGRARVLRQLLTESLLLSVAGTIAGLLVGWLGLRVLIALRPARLDAIKVAHLDATTLALSIAVAVVSAVVFALIGGLQASHHATHDALKSGAAGLSGTRRHGRARGFLVVSEMALSAVLLVGAVLLVRSLINLERADLGFDANHLYAQQVPLGGPRFEATEVRAQFFADLMRRVTALPGLQSATFASASPGTRWFMIGRLDVEGEPQTKGAATAFIDINNVQPNYFRIMRMSFRRGATFSDTSRTSRQLIVNESFARKHWPDGDAVGHRVRVADSDTTPWRTIVGVVGDASLSGPTAESTAPFFYFPRSQPGSTMLLVRSAGDARSLQPIGAMLQQMGIKRVPPPESVEEFISKSIAAPRFVMLLLAILTALALVLASIGLYGVMTYSVAQQTREIGIRVALGASSQRIARAVIGRASSLAIAGAIIGLVGAGWATKLIESQLHGVRRLDPSSFIVGAVVLLGAALIACVVPTRRALAVDPVTAIRTE
jgi:predicted permease